MNHGTTAAYTMHACRCEPCRRANMRVKKAWRIRTRADSDDVASLPDNVDLEPVRAHVAALLASGWTRTQIAHETGRSVQALYNVLDRRDRYARPKRIRRSVAAELLAIDPLAPADFDEVVVERLVRADDWRGITRTAAERDAAIRALDAAGVSRNEIARRSHVNSTTMYAALRAEQVAS